MVMTGETFRVLFFPSFLSLGRDSGYSHMRKQSIENLQYLKGPVLWHLISSLGSRLPDPGVSPHDGVVLRLGSVLLCVRGTLL